MQSSQNLLKQLALIPKSHGGHAEVTLVDDKLTELELTLNPGQGSIHQGAKYVFGIKFSRPELFNSIFRPAIWSKTPVFHPNIDDECICCNILYDEWVAGTTLDAIIAALYCLLENPAFDNALDDFWWTNGQDTIEEYESENYPQDLKAFIIKNF